MLFETCSGYHSVNWEYGSDWHWPDSAAMQALRANGSPDHVVPDGRLYESGRAALVTLIRHGMAKEEWKRIWLPSYYCGEVVAAVLQTEIAVSFYSDNPLNETVTLPPAKSGEVVLLVNYYGYRNAPATSIPTDIAVIEDHTHDPTGPWARQSRANYCFASLRKVLPIADGGVLWPPEAAELPPQIKCQPEHMQRAEKRMKAMRLKADYLAGRLDSKTEYRELHEETETAFDRISPGGPHPKTRELLNSLSLTAAAKLRRHNFAYLSDLLAQHSDVLFGAPDGEGQTPLGVILYFKRRAERDAVRERLIASAIYPAIIWPPATGFDAEATDFSERMLFLPCDYRYNRADLEIVAEKVHEAIKLLPRS